MQKLQPEFDAHGKQLKKEIAETLFPSVNCVKGAYHVLDEKIDASFTKGILTFNHTCKDVEAMAIKEEEELRNAWALAQVGVFDQSLFKMLIV